MEWQLEASIRQQDNEWLNKRYLGETPDRLQALLQDLTDYVPTYSEKALVMNSHVYLKVVLRVQRSSDESFFGQSAAPTTSKSGAKTEGSKT